VAKTGRPNLYHKINWDEFDKLVSYQCTQIEVAHFFGVSVDTLDDACRAELGETLAEIWQKRRSLGKVRLRKAQMLNVERGAPGWATMAIYLDKKMFPAENPDTPPPPTDPNPVKEEDRILTFNEFCIKSYYFEPFPKQEEMRAFGLDLNVTRLLLGSRGYGKTDYVTIMGVAYDLYLAWKTGKDLSEHTNLIITKSKARCGALIEEIGNALERNGVPLDKFTGSVIRIKGLIGQDHSVEAITIKTSMRGRHPKRIIMDDPVTDEDVSEAMRETVKRRYDEAYKLCKNILIIGQPAHALDLYAKLRGIIKTMEVPHGQIPELDADLEAMKLAGVDQHSIEMSYHLRIPVDGAVPFGSLKYTDVYPAGDSVAFIDPSEGGDYTAITILKMVGQGFVIEGYAWQRAWFLCLDEMVPIVKKLGVKKLCFETNTTGQFPLSQLRQVFGPIGVGVVGKNSDSNKEAVIMAAASMSAMLHLSKQSNAAYTEQVTGYTAKAKHDDAPDSLGRCLEWLGFIKGKSVKGKK